MRVCATTSATSAASAPLEIRETRSSAATGFSPAATASAVISAKSGSSAMIRCWRRRAARDSSWSRRVAPRMAPIATSSRAATGFVPRAIDARARTRANASPTVAQATCSRRKCSTVFRLPDCRNRFSTVVVVDPSFSSTAVASLSSGAAIRARVGNGVATFSWRSREVRGWSRRYGAIRSMSVNLCRAHVHAISQKPAPPISPMPAPTRAALIGTPASPRAACRSGASTSTPRRTPPHRPAGPPRLRRS